ncbi:MAG: AraC family transcriptional regulator [Lentisphaerae bacterium]|nr:MAG: AraC family transcriptional regulator [Lentisphaerota bacterium]
MQNPIESIGIDFRHSPEFTINRPEGLESYLFLHFISPVEIQTMDGKMVAPACSNILYSPAFPQWYRGHNSGLHNDWIHIHPDFLTPVIREYRFPVNRIVPFHHPQKLRMALREIWAEFIHGLPYSAQRLSLLLRLLFLDFCREWAATPQPRFSPHKRELLHRFRELRSQVHVRLDQSWSVARMARLVNLSPSRFTSLYSEFFGISPLNDLIEARLQRAHWLLSSTDMSVTEVAEASGFNNVFYFSRTFRRRFGFPPSAVREASR